MERSAGILVYRFNGDTLEVLLGKCGGPNWEKRNVGAWNIPKGHVEDGETDLSCAIREFNEETSLDIPFPSSCDELIDLGEATTNTGKSVKIFAVEYNFAGTAYKVPIKSNLCETEYPPKSGNIITVPELSDAYYFKVDVAKRMIFPYQKCFIERLEKSISSDGINSF